MKKRKLPMLIATLALSIGGACNANAQSAPEKSTSSIKSAAMQCYSIYSIMLEGVVGDEYATNILGSQAMLMGTVYVINSTKNRASMTQDEFFLANDISTTAILTAAETSRQSFIDKLINCEGWREQVVTSMSIQGEAKGMSTPSEIREVMENLPTPNVKYPLVGTTIMELSLLVDKSLTKYADNRK